MAAAETARATRLYNRHARFYDAYEWPMERAVYRRWRRRLWAPVEGRAILEVGVGTGRNIPFHPPQAHVTAVDFSEKMLARARQVPGAERVDLRLGDIERLEFSEGQFDAVVGSFVFCSVPDPAHGLEEVRRVLRPGGRLHLLEHVRSDRPGLGRALDWLNGLSLRGTGVNVNRRTVEAVAAAGFTLEGGLWLEPAHVFVLMRARRS